MTVGPLLAGNAAPFAEPPGVTVSVTVVGLRSEKGQLLACLTAMPRAFPDCSKDPHAQHLTVPAAGKVELKFQMVASGRYAISLLHDENGNGYADMVLMVPREGFGFSRDAAVHFGPPRFAAAAFTVAGVAENQTIRMRYMF